MIPAVGNGDKELAAESRHRDPCGDGRPVFRLQHIARAQSCVILIYTVTFAKASPAEATTMRLLMLLPNLDNLDDTNDPLLSPQAFLNATLSETDPTIQL